MAILKMTVEEKLKYEAKFGLFSADLNIGKVKANELRNKGIEVIDSKEVNYYPRTHHIRWKDSSVDCNDVYSLDENSDEYTLAQKLWIISMKSKHI